MKKFLISILAFIFIISAVTAVNAASGSINLSASSDTVVKGKTFTVTLVGTADNSITGLQSTLSYDTTKLSIESKSAGANFTDASGSDSEIAILSSGSTVEKSGTLYTITFKVLDTAEEGDVTISVTNATLALVNESSEQENVTVSDDSVTITIKADDTTVDNQGGATTDDDKTQTEEPKNTTTTPSNTTTGNKSTTTKSNSSSKKTTTKLPQTGVEMVSIVAIIALGAISISSYVLYRKYKNI